MLTDAERRRLLQIERELAEDDPRLARLLGAAGGWHRSRRARVWVLVFVVALLIGLGIGLGTAI